MIKNHIPTALNEYGICFTRLGKDEEIDVVILKTAGTVKAHRTTWEDEEDDFHTITLTLKEAQEELSNQTDRYYGIKEGWMTFDDIVTRYKYK